ncbi:hypothetical protein GCM10023194_59400 [Planotetraspora phitsanulokensis]|uniref:Predicted membrane protein YciQ-like C-terminal domain-containing protein n=1 Tax=Planotetraspora phitsanulokensis TaxID=575192 RepID=A0A8J3XHZ6_9ACTN|nr:DUF2207 domain-containing protein [Planotetraspora phitsanulokensis]GII40401.1 hypothetical protein Pph01_54040 [Planotetraspora phitsanulokensis]
MTMWIAAAAAVGLWLLLLLAFATATRTPEVKAAPATGALGEESPAIVDLLTGDWRLTNEAASATVLDLAAKGALAIEEIGPELSLVRLRRDPGDLNAYERLVYEHVRSLAVDGVVATGALAEGSRDISRWWKSFRKKVIVEARAQGLSRPRWSRAQAALLTTTAVAVAVLAGIAAEVSGFGSNVSDEEGSPGVAVGFFCFLVLAGLMSKLNGERGTKRGAELAGRWLGVRDHLAATGRFGEQPAASVTIWGRHLAYAAALGLAPRAVTSLPITTPADDSRAWSDYGGMWHPVHVRYRSRRFWGRKPLTMIGQGLLAGMMIGVWVFIILLVATSFDYWPQALLTPTPILVGGIIAALPIIYTIIDYSGNTVIQGQIVRLRTFGESSGDSPSNLTYYCAIDEGRAREVLAYGLPSELYGPLNEGDLVRAVAGKRMGWIRKVEVLEPARARGTAYNDTGEHLVNAPEHLGQVKLFERSDTSSRSGAPVREGDVRPADLVTPADLKSALGIDVGSAGPYDGTPLAPAWFHVSSCRYTGSGWTVDVHAASGKRSRYLMVLGHMLTRAEGKPVPGVGRQAMLYPGVVSATNDNGTFTIAVSTPDGPPPPDPMIALARAAVTRLGPA